MASHRQFLDSPEWARIVEGVAHSFMHHALRCGGCDDTPQARTSLTGRRDGERQVTRAGRSRANAARSR